MMEGNINLSAELRVSSYNKQGEFLENKIVKTISLLEFLYFK